MVTRAETAAATRSALLRAASELLDEGGATMVTLRGVGARAGVSRGAPYGHFANKEQLLAAIAIAAWDSLAEEVEQLRTGPGDPSTRLESAVMALIGRARGRPHLYALMFATPAEDREAMEAARRLQDGFLDLVGDVVGTADATRYTALLMSSAHGIAELERSGHLGVEKWQVDSEQLVRMAIDGIRLSARD